MNREVDIRQIDEQTFHLLNNLEIEKVKREHKEWLETRPWWHERHRLLQEYVSSLVPGSHLVATPFDDDSKEVMAIIKYGTIRVIGPNDLVFKKMETNQCHQNIRKLFLKGVIHQLDCGFALSKDGLWRFHSWGIDFRNRVVETTEPRLAYLSGIKIRQVQD